MKVARIALVGNPNSGKTSVFNQLTGLNQQVGNYPGVTVEKKTGTTTLPDQRQLEIIDLPGTYSLYPRSEDERVVFDYLSDREQANFPDLIIVVVDASNLERNLLLFTQLYDRKLPLLLALNMIDLSDQKGQLLDMEKLEGLLGGVPVLPLNARSGIGIEALKKAILDYQGPTDHFPFVNEQARNEIGGAVKEKSLEIPDQSIQAKESEVRYEKIKELLQFVVSKTTKPPSNQGFNHKLDRLFVHPIGGYVIFLAILFLMFQAVYSFAEWPMNLIDSVFLNLSQWSKSLLPEGVLTDLIAEGVIPGIGGVVIFIPQIALLFLFIALLEESGYMARAVFIMDKLMRPFGLNGKSVVPLISGLACAVPAIMAARTISNWKERIITIMVTPLMSCAARLPVYTILIALVIPDGNIGGFFSWKGLTLFALYLMGLLASLLAALVFKWLLNSKEQSFLILELPSYKWPNWKNIGLTIWEKTKIFVWEAGKIILAISIVLWGLASYGPGDRMASASAAIPLPDPTDTLAVQAYDNAVSSAQLENSYIGLLGKAIEPAIKPLGYDWKIGIALITSFAAREVFVGTMAIIYSVGEDFEEDKTLLERMRSEVNPQTGLPVYSLASGISLMLFYAFAMQCMSTLAIVYRETKRWKWPIIQLVYMTILAYVAAFIAYQLLAS